MTSIVSLARRLAAIPAIVAAIALFLMMTMTFADVLLRSILNSPIEAATELTRILMAVIVFSVLPVISGRGDHIAVDLLDPWFIGAAKRLRDGAVAILCGAMLFWPAERAWALADRARSYGDMTEYLSIPQYYPAMFVAVLTFLTAAVMIGRGLLILFAPKSLMERIGA